MTRELFGCVMIVLAAFVGLDVVVRGLTIHVLMLIKRDDHAQRRDEREEQRYRDMMIPPRDATEDTTIESIRRALECDDGEDVVQAAVRCRQQAMTQPTVEAVRQALRCPFDRDVLEYARGLRAAQDASLGQQALIAPRSVRAEIEEAAAADRRAFSVSLPGAATGIGSSSVPTLDLTPDVPKDRKL